MVRFSILPSAVQSTSLNVSAVLAGMAHDARSRRWRIVLCRDEIRKFLVFIAKCAALQLPMLRCAFHALRKMTPVARSGHGTGEMMWTRRENCSRTGNQGRADGIDGGKAAPRSRLHDHKKFAGAFPCFIDHGFSGGLRQLSQRVRNHHQIVLFARKSGAQVLLQPLCLLGRTRNRFARQDACPRRPNWRRIRSMWLVGGAEIVRLRQTTPYQDQRRDRAGW